MKFYNKNTVAEQLRRLPSEYQSNYSKAQLDRISIDGEVIQGYFEYSFLEEKSYVEQPTRAIDGSIGNIDDIETILTPRLIIKYNMMHIDDYRILMKKLKSKNSFNVTCYDIVEDKMVTREMYAAPTQMPIMYQQYLKVLGIQEFTLELIGTNNDYNSNIPTPPDARKYKVTYYFDLPLGINNPFINESYVQYTDFFGGFVVGAYDNNSLVGNTDLFSTDGTKGYRFEGWLSYDGTSIYQNGTALTISDDTTLTAVWSEYSMDTTVYTLVMHTGNIYNAIESTHKFYYADNMELFTDEVLQTIVKTSKEPNFKLSYNLPLHPNSDFGDRVLYEEDPNASLYIYNQWTFKGWSIDTNNENDLLYKNGSLITVNKQITHVYMQWDVTGVEDV